MPSPGIDLKILLPFGTFAQKTGVTRIVAETDAGSYGFWPNRLDCVAALVPGILIYQNGQDAEVFVAVDEGILVKTGTNVSISVRGAIAGTDLSQLRNAVEKDFMTLSGQEKSVRSVMAQMESDFVRRFMELKHA